MPRSGDSAFCCQLRLGKKERLSYIPLVPLYFIFGRNGKHLAQRRRPSILHHSFTPPLRSPNREEVVVVVVVVFLLWLLHSRRLVFYLFFSLSLWLSLLSAFLLPSCIHSVSSLFRAI